MLAALGSLQAFAESLVGKVFSGIVSDKAKGAFAAMRERHAQSRAALSFMETLEPFFATEMRADEANFLVHTLRTRFESFTLAPSRLAANRFNLETIAASLIASSPVSGEYKGTHLEESIDTMTREIVKVMWAVGTVIPEWERLSWQENFRSFREMQDKLSQQNALLKNLSDDRAQRATAFEQTYRRCVAGDLKYVQLKGVGSVSNTRALSLDSLFTQMRMKRTMRVDEGAGRASSQPGIAAETRADDAQNRALSPPKAGGETVAVDVAIRHSRRLVVLGAPGGGKSTLVQFIAMQAALEEGVFTSDELGSTVPFLLRVRSFTDFDKLPGPKDLIGFCAPLLDRPETAKFAVDAIESERALLIVDGLDECQIDNGREPGSLQTERSRVLAWIRSLTHAYPTLRILATSRPAGYHLGELADAGFDEYNLLPLDAEQQKLFVRRWCRAVELSISPEDAAPAELRAAAEADDLIHRIANAKSIRTLAFNPLMLSVICVLHKYRGDRLPERKVDLLNECMNILLYDFRSASGLSRNIIGDLDSRDLRSLLEPLAWKMTVDGNDQLDEEAIKAVFAAHLPEIRQPVERAAEILAIIRDRSGVLIESAPQVYEFMHLLFQEYLAAEECASRADSYDVLMRNVDNQRWREIVPMAVAASRMNQETLVRSLVQMGAVPLAALAVSMIGRCSVSLRTIVAEALRDYPARMYESFTQPDISMLLEEGSEDALAAVVRLVTLVPVMESAALKDFVRDFEYANNQLDLNELASSNAHRAIRWSFVSLGESWAHIYDIGYFGEDGDFNNGASWISLGLAACVPAPAESLPGRHFMLDPVYNYAVMLDLAEANQASVSHCVWRVFESVISMSDISIESKLLALHFAWNVADADSHAEALLDFLDQLPRDIFPAFRIGTINNLVRRVSPDVYDRIRHRTIELWARAVDDVEFELSKLIRYWIENELVVTVDDDPDPVETFRAEFRRALDEEMKDLRRS